VKQGTDALSKMPIVRSYVEDSVALLVRPTMTRRQALYQSKDLFEPGTADLSDDGQPHLTAVANGLNENRAEGSEVVVVAYHDPKDKGTAPAVAQELTKKQAEVVAEFLKAGGVRKLGTFSRRKITPLGMGTDLAPDEPNPDAPSNVQILTFTPR
jgi:outer membrane protein OmpA-like peptidoglycan-associated protein